MAIDPVCKMEVEEGKAKHPSTFRECSYTMVMPPSRVRDCPVIKAASSEAR